MLLVCGVAPSINAGDFHAMGSLACSDCHVMHYSETHTLTGGITPDPLLGSGGPFPKLLKNTQSQLCLSCHDGRTNAPDVRGANTGSYVRAAGQLNLAGDGVEGTGHTIGSTAAPPGGTWNNPGLQCTHCHDAHGNGYYRNLTASPGTATGKTVTFTTGSTYTGTAAVQQLATSPIATHYAVSNIRYRQSQVASTDFGLSTWCGGCHGSIHADSNSTFIHPTQGVTMSQGVADQKVDPNHWFSDLASRVPVVSPSGTIPGTSSGSDNQVFCGSCHKAHGSQNTKGLIYDDDSTPALEDGTDLNQTCQQCHYL